MFNKKRVIPLLFVTLLTVFSLCGCVSESNSASNISSDRNSYELSEDLKVSFLDVGQGDSIFLELPNKESMLIDAGNPDDADYIANYIQDAGYSNIDYVVGTHPHSDHIGGLTEIIRKFDIGSIYMPKISNNTNSFEKLLSEIISHNYEITVAKAGKKILNDKNLNIDIIAPVESSYYELNDYSAVIKVDFGSTSFLFMGDAEKLSESQITTDVDADVIKIGHHGSESSSSSLFLDKVSPTYAVISVGAGNTYGHPSDRTLDTLSSKNIITYRTDYDGTIVFTSDGSKITANKMPSSDFIVQTTSDVDPIVYITNTGSKYHREGCPYLSKSKIPISLSEAILNYEPCSQCNPSQ